MTDDATPSSGQKNHAPRGSANSLFRQEGARKRGLRPGKSLRRTETGYLPTPFRGVVLLLNGLRPVVGHDALASLPPNSQSLINGPVDKITKLTVVAIYGSMT